MTLLVAGIDEASAWMVADTAITEGEISPRERVYKPKIEAAHNSSLLGFAGDFHYGQRTIREAALLPPGEAVLDFLVKGHREVPSVDFAYAFWTGHGPRLFRITGRGAEELATLHLGDDYAFNTFQSIRHKDFIDHAPKALHQLLCAVEGLDTVPEGLMTAISTMQQLFASRQEHNVGGWAVPYLLTKNGAQLCSYAYAVTDPILDKLPSGTLIPHGTAEAGGFGLSFTSLQEGDGMVVYWLQRPGGLVILRTEGGYEVHNFLGTPTVFRGQVQAALGRAAHLWFGDQPAGTPKSVSFLRDEHGRPRLAVTQDDETFSFAWVQNTEEPFRASGAITMDLESTRSAAPDPAKPMRLDALMAADGKTATLELLNEGQPLGHIISTQLNSNT